MQLIPSVVPAYKALDAAAGCVEVPGAGLLADAGVGADAEAAGEGAEADWTKLDWCASKIGPRRYTNRGSVCREANGGHLSFRNLPHWWRTSSGSTSSKQAATSRA